jgi:hypothetical protein
MVTTRNSHQDTVNSNAEASLLLDKLRSVLSSARHLASLYGDMLKYIHEKPPCYNKCKKAQMANVLIIRNAGRENDD